MTGRRNEVRILNEWVTVSCCGSKVRHAGLYADICRHWVSMTGSSRPSRAADDVCVICFFILRGFRAQASVQLWLDGAFLIRAGRVRFFRRSGPARSLSSRVSSAKNVIFAEYRMKKQEERK